MTPANRIALLQLNTMRRLRGLAELRAIGTRSARTAIARFDADDRRVLRNDAAACRRARQVRR